MKKTALFFLLFLVPALTQAGPIYVWKEPDGAIRFTTKQPPPGVTAKVFSAKKASFSVYHIPAFRSSVLHRKAYAPLIEEAARRHELDPSLVRAVIHVESGFNPHAVSSKGARGLMQLLPSRARLLGVKDSFNPEENIRGGTRHLAFLLRKFDGNLAFALAAYNAGEGAVEKYGGIPPYDETRQYVRRVFLMKDKYGKVQRG